MKNSNHQKTRCVHIVGGGLAGVEAAWNCLQNNIKVVLHEMRPLKMTPAHKTDKLAELVCSNSFKSQDPMSASGQLKYEMQCLNSIVIESAQLCKVPAGKALAVDRYKFSEYITQKLLSHPLITLIREEICTTPDYQYLENNNEAWIIATGPLSSECMTDTLTSLCEDPQDLYFYDAISPIVDISTVDLSLCFRQNRYQKPDEQGDYINIPLSKEEYENFVKLILDAPKVPLKPFEEQKYFEGCLPIEVMAQRGIDTLRFGPMKSVGLVDPKTGKQPWAVIQLRAENINQTMYNLVGFQTKMTYAAQLEVFKSIKALRNATFLRLGSIHRNTYINASQNLNENLSFKKNPRVFLAGQLTGVEGYLESASIGILAGMFATALVLNKKIPLPPHQTIIGSLLKYVTQNKTINFTPMNANLGILSDEQFDVRVNKHDRNMIKIQIAQQKINEYIQECNKTLNEYA